MYFDIREIDEYKLHITYNKAPLSNYFTPNTVVQLIPFGDLLTYLSPIENAIWLKADLIAMRLGFSNINLQRLINSYILATSYEGDKRIIDPKSIINAGPSDGGLCIHMNIFVWLIGRSKTEDSNKLSQVLGIPKEQRPVIGGEHKQTPFIIVPPEIRDEPAAAQTFIDNYVSQENAYQYLQPRLNGSQTCREWWNSILKEEY